MTPARIAAALVLATAAFIFQEPSAGAQTPPRPDPFRSEPGKTDAARTEAGKTEAGKAGAALPTEEDVDEPSPEEMGAKPPVKGAAKPPRSPVAAPQGVIGESPRTDGVILRALDKVTAHITRIEVALNQTAVFGTLAITPRACAMRPPEETPESSAFLEIDDRRRDGVVARVFSGWMFASSPALSALEHPAYDVWVTACRIAATPASPGGGAKR